MRLLGGGSSYEAYLAFDEITFFPVVVKVLRPGRVTDEASLRGLRREAAALEVLNHPVAVRGLRHDVAGERPHLVIEHVDGPRLSTLIRKTGPLQPQQYLPWPSTPRPRCTTSAASAGSTWTSSRAT